MNIEEHLLTCLAEECAEVAKEATKALRFGIDDVNPQIPHGPNQRENIVNELNDLIAVAELLRDHGIIPIDWWNLDKQQAKKQKVARFMRYAHQKGALK